jgi:hypothetical protein
MPGSGEVALYDDVRYDDIPTTAARPDPADLRVHPGAREAP